MFKTIAVAATIGTALAAKPDAADHTTYTDFDAIVKHVNVSAQSPFLFSWHLERLVSLHFW